MISVAEMMTTDPVTLPAGASLAEVQAVMAKYNCHHVPIVSRANQLVGLVSQRDVLRVTESSLSGSTALAAESINVLDFMTRNVFTVKPETSLRKAAIYIRTQRFGCLPVLAADKLVGLITDSDFVNIAINLLEQLEDAEPAAAD